MKALTYLTLPLLLFALAACDMADSTNEVAPLGLASNAAAEEEVGNNLSFPVIWGDRVSMALRGTYGEAHFGGAFFDTPGEMWYVQQDPLNEWQAESAPPDPNGSRFFYVSAVDWGDNLEARDWPAGRQIRVEVVLYRALAEPMLAYTMRSEDPTVHGPDEVWGTNGTTFLSDTATVYSAAAQMVVQKLTKTRDDPSLSVTWTGDHWTGDVEPPIFSQGVWEAPEGPGGFKAEVNAKGQVIYGLNWLSARQTGSRPTPGDYRLTFVLQPDNPVPMSTHFNSQTTIMVSEEDDHPEPAALYVGPGGGGPTGGGTAALMWEHNLTYIDVRLTGGN